MDAYGLRGISTSTAAVNAKETPPTFVGSVHYADERVSLLVSRLAALADKLCGPAPEEQSNALKSVSSGVFGEVMDRAHDIAGRADLGIEMLNRIERALP